MAQPNAGRLITSRSGTPLYGRTDGVGILPGASASLSGGLVAIANGAISRALEPAMLCEVFEDFIGFQVLPDVDTSDLAQGIWAQQNTGTSNVPVRVDDADNGVFKLLLSNSNEVGDATLYWGAQQNIDSDLGPIMMCRVKTGVIGAAADSMSWGFASAYNALRDSVANNAWFSLEGASLALKLESDDATTDNDGKAASTEAGTAVTLVADTWYEFMVSMNAAHQASPVDVRFFYRDTLGGDWTRLVSGSTVFKFGADIATQPYFQVEKTSGTTTPDLQIDYAHVIWPRG